MAYSQMGTIPWGGVGGWGGGLRTRSTDAYIGDYIGEACM